MAVQGIGQDLLSSLSGNVESAYITIHDFRSKKASTTLKPDLVKEALVKGTDGFKIANAKDKHFRVQFNPSELQIYSTTDNLEKIDAQKEGEEKKKDTLVDSPTGARLELSTTLFFDKMNTSTSFMMQKNLLPTSVSGVTNLVSLGRDSKHTVQTEVEGFISALRNIYTQLVTFHWADFTFTGTLLHVGAQYTMFSMAGTPVRAKVSLRIRQERNGQCMQPWIDDFEKAFGGDQSSLVRTEQSFGNLLNLGL